jgi:hypothetical protein
MYPPASPSHQMMWGILCPLSARRSGHRPAHLNGPATIGGQTERAHESPAGPEPLGSDGAEREPKGSPEGEGHRKPSKARFYALPVTRA